MCYFWNMLIFEEQDARNDQDYNTQWRDNKETEEKIERLGSEMNFLKDILLGELHQS